MRINKEIIGKVIKSAAGIALYGVAMAAPYVSEDVVDVIRYSGNVTYSDAVDVVMRANMYSSDKTKVLDMLRKDGDKEYYKAIIKVIKSDMYSGDKIRVIKNLNEE